MKLDDHRINGQTAAQAALDLVNEQINAVLNDPAASYWLKSALRQAVTRDPLDAERDVFTAAELIHNWSVAVMRVATNDGGGFGET